MYAVRRWAVHHAAGFEWLYRHFEGILVKLHPLLQRLGYERLERPVVAVERQIKGLLFDCQMCGQCVLSSTGMSCPMNCPKELRNGPCGGVRPDGRCEVKPAMMCVWVDAYEGSRRMRGGAAIHTVQFAPDRRLRGHSSWLREIRRKAGGAETP